MLHIVNTLEGGTHPFKISKLQLPSLACPKLDFTQFFILFFSKCSEGLENIVAFKFSKRSTILRILQYDSSSAEGVTLKSPCSKEKVKMLS